MNVNKPVMHFHAGVLPLLHHRFIHHHGQGVFLQDMAAGFQGCRSNLPDKIESSPEQGIQHFVTGGIGKGGNNHHDRLCPRSGLHCNGEEKPVNSFAPLPPIFRRTARSFLHGMELPPFSLAFKYVIPVKHSKKLVIRQRLVYWSNCKLSVTR